MAFSKITNASTCRALNSPDAAAPIRFQTRNSSTVASLSAVIADRGHRVNTIPPRAQTIRPSSSPPSHAHFRFLSSPAFRHVSHSQPAWLAK
jgi:hypothetical protein